MLVGAQPFHDSSVDLILAKVNRCEFDVPATVSAAACDLVEGLLRRDPNCRNNLTQTMLHPWTSGKALVKTEVLKTLHEAKGGILGSCSGTAQVALKGPLLQLCHISRASKGWLSTPCSHLSLKGIEASLPVERVY